MNVRSKRAPKRGAMGPVRRMGSSALFSGEASQRGVTGAEENPVDPIRCGACPRCLRADRATGSFLGLRLTRAGDRVGRLMLGRLD